MCHGKFIGKEKSRGSLRVWLLSSLLAKVSRETNVPDDVKEGHLAVLAMKGFEKKRFIVKLECLTHPEFVELLDQAENEFGFEQVGTLVVPCLPEELQKILEK